MNNKKDNHIMIGIVIAIIVVILAVVGYKQFGTSVEAPQIEGNLGTTETVNVLPTGSELIGKENNSKMNPVQVIKKDSGLVVEILQEGAGEPVKSGDMVSVDYRGQFTNGQIFDESYKRGQQFQFKVGAGMVIAGWDEGLLGMKVGEKRRLTVPSNLGYGPNDYGPIPGGSTLIFDIELHKIN